jgi:hypothetical protein
VCECSNNDSISLAAYSLLCSFVPPFSSRMYICMHTIITAFAQEKIYSRFRSMLQRAEVAIRVGLLSSSFHLNPRVLALSLTRVLRWLWFDEVCKLRVDV